MDLYLTGEGESPCRILASGTVECCPPSRPMASSSRTSRRPRPNHGRVAADDRSSCRWTRPGRLALPSCGCRSRLSRATTSCAASGGSRAPNGPRTGAGIAYLLPPTDEALTSHLQPGVNTNHLAELHVVATLDGQDRVINAGKLAYQDGRFAWLPESDAIAYPAADGASGGPPRWRPHRPSLSAPTMRPSGTPGELRDAASNDGDRRDVADPDVLAVTVLVTSLEHTDHSLHLVDLDTTGSDRTLELTSTGQAQQVGHGRPMDPSSPSASTDGP